VTYECRYPTVEAIRFDSDPKTIGRLRKFIGIENIRKESTFINDHYFVKVDGNFQPLNEGDYVALHDNKIVVYTVNRFFDIYKMPDIEKE
jgi:hypothetical protein